jgi:SAM-dependent methyltransferase
MDCNVIQSANKSLVQRFSQAPWASRLRRKREPPQRGDSARLVGSFYKAAFGRLAEPQGLAHHMRQLQSGLTPEVLAEQLVGSTEFQARYGSSQNVDTEFLTALYRDGLGREPDPEGLAHWLAEGEKGASRAKVLAAFAGSDEALQKVVASANPPQTGDLSLLPDVPILGGALKRVYRSLGRLGIGLLNRILNIFGYKAVPKGLGYLSAREVVTKARQKNLSLCEYLEENNVGGVGKRRDLIINALQQYLPLRLTNVLEIGAGTGMYLERIVELCSPTTYEVYETSLEWVGYLNQVYSERTGLKCHNADGSSLRGTTSASVDAAFCHGVFVYLPLITTIGYLEEMVRVTKPEGWIIFDCFLTQNFGVDIVKQWQSDPYRYTFPVAISEDLIKEFLAKYGLICVGRFDTPYHASFSTYFVLRKRSSE